MTPLDLSFLLAFGEDLVSDFFGDIDGFSPVDQLANDGTPGLLDCRAAGVLVEGWRESSTSWSAWLLFCRVFRESQGTDQLHPMLGAGQDPGMDFALRSVWFLDPDESELLELCEPSVDGAAVSVELFSEPPVPEPAGVWSEAVEISEEVFFIGVEQSEFLTADPDGQFVELLIPVHGWNPFQK